MSDSTKTDNIDLLDAGSYRWQLKTHYNPNTDEHIISVTSIEWEHELIHEGKLFQLSGRITALGAGATTYLHGLTDGGQVHFRAAEIITDGVPVDVVLYEDSDITANGTELFGKNKNRNFSDTHTFRIFAGPTIGVAGLGTELEWGFIPVAGPGQTGGTAGLFATEWVLDDASNYVIGITNNDLQAIDISYSYNFLWYEVDPTEV